PSPEGEGERPAAKAPLLQERGWGEVARARTFDWSSPMIPPRFSFDAAYYRKYYEDPRTRVTDTSGRAPLADFLFAYLRYLRIPVRRVLDLGCGTGLWRQEVLRHHPKARYTGVEKSEYACRKYGWKQGCVTTYRSRTPFDLVICHD